MSDNNCIIKVENVTKSFGENIVLENINTEVNRGDIIAVIGPSGCGKSTFIRTLNLLEIPESGSIYIDGIDLKQINPYWLRYNIGVVLQENYLFSVCISTRGHNRHCRNVISVFGKKRPIGTVNGIYKQLGKFDHLGGG